ncbi:MAG TPA: isoprenylcysteine carboxylmethyltransferase family protein [Solirubrobacterales bacterium]
MAEAALVLYAVYMALAFGLRSYLMWRATGATGFKGISGKPGSLEWIAGALFIVALVVGVAAPVLALTGAAEPLAALDEATLNWIGVALAVAGIAATLYAQVAMGESWRIGVDPGERTELVTSGPFAWVRNPIFAAMIPTGLGLALMVPNVPAIVGFAALVIALELQVRLVEEPYLLAQHGERYREYARRTGRFVPGVGKLRRS